MARLRPHKAKFLVLEIKQLNTAKRPMLSQMRHSWKPSIISVARLRTPATTSTSLQNCLKNANYSAITTFNLKLGNKIYRQRGGLNTGSPLGSIPAFSFCQRYEDDAFVIANEDIDVEQNVRGQTNLNPGVILA